MKVPYIPEEAPFSEDQRAWLSGFLAGLHSRSVMAQTVAPAAQAEVKTPVNILYGTQTGNAESVANDAASIASANGLSPTVAELNAVEMDALAAMKHVFIVVSTYGEGEMPDNADLFWEGLSAPTAPRLEDLKYTVLALGDTSYDEFCQAGKLIDMRFEQLGAERLSARVDCDVDYEDLAENWISEAVSLASASDGDASPVAVDVKPTAKKEGWNRKNPYPAKTVENRLMSGPKSAKEIRHFAFDLGDSGITYEAGDALGVMPVNNSTLVSALIERLKAQPDTQISGQDDPLEHLLTHKFEILTPPKTLIAEIEKRADNEELSHVVANGDKEALEAYMWGRDTLDLLKLNPAWEIDVDEFISWLKPLQHRAYSISSSLKAHPNEVHLTVASVRW
ncbi:MAG: sulfite reductase flavoprotein subunit alpha, partial [Pseudomonadota bacterium]